MRIKLAVAAALPLLLLTTACATESGGRSDAEVVSADAPSDEPTEEVAEEPSEEPAPPSTLNFGEAFTFQNGLTVIVSDVQTFAPSADLLEFIDNKPADPIGLKYQVQIQNGTDQVFEAPGVTTSVTAGVDGVGADALCDSSVGIDCFFAQSVQPGKNTTMTDGVLLSKSRLGEVNIQVNVGFEYEDITYTGAVTG